MCRSYASVDGPDIAHIGNFEVFATLGGDILLRIKKRPIKYVRYEFQQFYNQVARGDSESG